MYGEKQAYDENRGYTVKSRQLVFERELESLKMLMYGGRIRVLPFMTDDWGEYSEKKTVDLVHQIINSEPYPGRHSWDWGQRQEQTKVYPKLLYCVLRALTAGYTEYRNGNAISFEKPEEITFSSVLFALEGGEELLDFNIVYFMQSLYEILAGKAIDLTPLNYGLREQEMTEEMRRQMEEEADAWHTEEDSMAKKLDLDMEEIRREDQKELERQEKQRAAEQERIRHSFTSAECFCKNIEEIALYLKTHPVKAGELHTEIRERIFQFLSDRELSVFDDEEAFVEVMVQLKRTIRMAQSHAEDEL